MRKLDSEPEIVSMALSLKLDDGERAFLEEPYRPADVINDYNPVRRPRAHAGEGDPQ